MHSLVILRDNPKAFKHTQRQYKLAMANPLNDYRLLGQRR